MTAPPPPPPSAGGTGNSNNSRRDRALSLTPFMLRLASTPQRASAQALTSSGGSANDGGAALLHSSSLSGGGGQSATPDRPSLGQRRMRHGRQSSADWSDSLSVLRETGGGGASSGSGAMSIPAGVSEAAEEDEIEGLEVPFYANTRYDYSSPRAHTQATTAAAAASTAAASSAARAAASSPSNSSSSGGSGNNLSVPATPTAIARRNSAIGTMLERMKIDECDAEVDGAESDEPQTMQGAASHDASAASASASSARQPRSLVFGTAHEPVAAGSHSPPHSGGRPLSLSLQLHSPGSSNTVSPFLVTVEPTEEARPSSSSSSSSQQHQQSADGAEHEREREGESAGQEQQEGGGAWTGSAPSTSTTSPTTRQRVEAIEYRRPHTTSHAMLSARGGGGGGGFGAAAYHNQQQQQQMAGSAIGQLAASPRAAMAASSSPYATDEVSPHTDGPSSSTLLVPASPCTPVSAPRLSYSASPPHVYASPPSASSGSSGVGGGGGGGHSRHVSFPNLSPAQQRALVRASPEHSSFGGSSGGGGRTPGGGGGGSSASPYASPYAYPYSPNPYPYPSTGTGGGGGEHRRQGSSLSIVTDHSYTAGAAYSSSNAWGRAALERDRERERERLDSITGSELTAEETHALMRLSQGVPSGSLTGAARWARVVRARLLPTLRGRWSSHSIVRRFLSHQWGHFDVSSMLAQKFSLDEFRQRVAARLHHMGDARGPRSASSSGSGGGADDGGSNGSSSGGGGMTPCHVSATTEIMVSMFSSLKTFHRLLDGTSVLNAHLSKRQALQNIISTVHSLLDAERVTIFLLHHREGEGGAQGTTTLKAVTGVVRQGHTVLRPADSTVASELVSIVARTGELRNVRDCDAEPLCWIGGGGAGGAGGAQGQSNNGSTASNGNDAIPSASPLSPSFSFSPSPPPSGGGGGGGGGSYTPLTPSHTSSSGYFSHFAQTMPASSYAGGPGAVGPGMHSLRASPRQREPGHAQQPSAGSSGEWGGITGTGSGANTPKNSTASSFSTSGATSGGGSVSFTVPVVQPLAPFTPTRPPPCERGYSVPVVSSATAISNNNAGGDSIVQRSFSGATPTGTATATATATAPSAAACASSPLSASSLASPVSSAVSFAPGTSNNPAHPHPHPHPHAHGLGMSASASTGCLTQQPAFFTPQHGSTGGGASMREFAAATNGNGGGGGGGAPSTTRHSDSSGGASLAPLQSNSSSVAAAHLFSRAAPAPLFKLRNCLCVPVRGTSAAGGSGSGSKDASVDGPGSGNGNGSGGNTGSKDAGKVVAVIQLVNKKSGPFFTSEDVQILQFVSQLAGQSLSNASLYEEALVRRRQQEALCTMIELMSAETGVDEVIECIIDAAYRLLDVDRISLYMIDEPREQLVCKVSKDASAIGQRLPLKWGLIGRVAAEGLSVNIRDAPTDPRFDQILDRVTGYTTRNILTLPIQDSSNRVAAVLQVVNKKKGFFTPEDETLMMSLSRSAGQILRKATLFSALLVEQRKTKALMAILQAEEGEVSIEALLDKVLSTTHEVLPCQKVALFVVDAVREDFYTLVADAPRQGPPPTATTAMAAATATPATGGATAGGVSSSERRRSQNQPGLPASAVVSAEPGAAAASAGATTSSTTPASSTAASPSSLASTPSSMTGGGALASPRAGTGAGADDTAEGAATAATAAAGGAQAASGTPFYSARGSPARAEGASATPGGAGSAGVGVVGGGSREAKHKRSSAKSVAAPVASTTRHMSLPLRRGLAGWAAEQGQSVNVANAAADPRYDPLFDKMFDKSASVAAAAAAAAGTATAAVAVPSPSNDSAASPATATPSATPGSVSTPSAAGTCTGTTTSSSSSAKPGVKKSRAVPFRTQTSLCVPLLNNTGTTIAVLQLFNRVKKKEKRTTSRANGSGSGSRAPGASPPSSSSSSVAQEVIVPFSDEDEEILRALCIQAGITLRRRLTEVLLGRSRRELGDDSQISSLFAIYGGNYLAASGAPPALSSSSSTSSLLAPSSSAGGGGAGGVDGMAAVPQSRHHSHGHSSHAHTHTHSHTHSLSLSQQGSPLARGGSDMCLSGMAASPASGVMSPSNAAAAAAAAAAASGSKTKARRKTLSEAPSRKPVPLNLPKSGVASPTTPATAPTALAVATTTGTPASAPATTMGSTTAAASPPSLPPSAALSALSKRATTGGIGGMALLPTIPSSPSPAPSPLPALTSSTSVSAAAAGAAELDLGKAAMAGSPVLEFPPLQMPPSSVDAAQGLAAPSAVATEPPTDVSGPPTLLSPSHRDAPAPPVDHSVAPSDSVPVPPPIAVPPPVSAAAVSEPQAATSEALVAPVPTSPVAANLTVLRQPPPFPVSVTAAPNTEADTAAGKDDMASTSRAASPPPLSPSPTDSESQLVPSECATLVPGDASGGGDDGAIGPTESGTTPPAIGFVTSSSEIALTRRRLGSAAQTYGPPARRAASSDPSGAASTASANANADVGPSGESKALLPYSASASTSTGVTPLSPGGGVVGASRYAWPSLVDLHLSELDVSALHSIDEFNVFDYAPAQLVHLSLAMLTDLGLAAEFSLALPKLQGFLVAVMLNYNDNAYHCYYHGFAVMHFAYWMLRTTEAGAFLPKLEQLALLLASLAHDVDHPGSTNGFQIAAQSDVALAHNDQSVLENHHAFVFFELLRDPDLNIFAPPPEPLDAPQDSTGTSPSSSGSDASDAASPSSSSSVDTSSSDASQTPSPSASESGAGAGADGNGGSGNTVVPQGGSKWSLASYRQFRKMVITAILATDMSKHFDLCRKLDNMEPDCNSLDPNKEEDRQFMIDLLTHSADLSGQVLPYHMAAEWESRLTEEFIWQAGMEQQLGLPVSTFMQGLSDPTVRFKNHLNYLDYIASPLWMGVAELLPPLGACVRNLLDNRKRFMRFIPQDEADQAAAAAHAAAQQAAMDQYQSPPPSEPVSPCLDPDHMHPHSLPSMPHLHSLAQPQPQSQSQAQQQPPRVTLDRPRSVGLLRQQRGFSIGSSGAGSGTTSGQHSPPVPSGSPGMRGYSFYIMSADEADAQPQRGNRSLSLGAPDTPTSSGGHAAAHHHQQQHGSMRGALGAAHAASSDCSLCGLSAEELDAAAREAGTCAGAGAGAGVGSCATLDESSNTPTPTSARSAGMSMSRMVGLGLLSGGGGGGNSAGGGYHTPPLVHLHRRKHSAPLAFHSSQSSSSGPNTPTPHNGAGVGAGVHSLGVAAAAAGFVPHPHASGVSGGGGGGYVRSSSGPGAVVIERPTHSHSLSNSSSMSVPSPRGSHSRHSSQGEPLSSNAPSPGRVRAGSLIAHTLHGHGHGHGHGGHHRSSSSSSTPSTPHLHPSPLPSSLLAGAGSPLQSASYLHVDMGQRRGHSIADRKAARWSVLTGAGGGAAAGGGGAGPVAPPGGGSGSAITPLSASGSSSDPVKALPLYAHRDRERDRDRDASFDPLPSSPPSSAPPTTSSFLSSKPASFQ